MQNYSFLGEHGKGDYDKNDVKVMIMLEHWVKISPYKLRLDYLVTYIRFGSQFLSMLNDLNL